MQRKPFTRRRFMATSAAVSASMIAAPFVRSSRAAGSLTIGMWDHWVPGANDMQSAIIKEWADAEKVDVKIDYITSQGNKLMLTLAAEELAKSGHDIMEFTNWEAAQHATSLEPTDDVMKQVLERNGPIDPSVEYLAKWNGAWVTVPMTRGSLLMSVCSRFDLLKEHAGIDLQAMYPAGKDATAEADKWTWEALLVAAEKLQKAGFAFGIPLGVTTDSVLWTGGMFKAFGADLIDAKGNVTAKSDAVRQAVDYGKRLAAFLLSLSRRYQRLGSAANRFVLHMTREEIGSYLGLTIETVSRVLSRFQREGLIGVRQREVDLKNAGSLRDMVG